MLTLASHCCDVVFHDDRDAMKRASRPEEPPFKVECRRLFQRAWVGLDYRAEGRTLQVYLLDSREVRLRHRSDSSFDNRMRIMNLDEVNAAEMSLLQSFMQLRN